MTSSRKEEKKYLPSHFSGITVPILKPDKEYEKTKNCSCIPFTTTDAKVLQKCQLIKSTGEKNKDSALGPTGSSQEFKAGLTRELLTPGDGVEEKDGVIVSVGVDRAPDKCPLRMKCVGQPATEETSWTRWRRPSHPLPLPLLIPVCNTQRQAQDTLHAGPRCWAWSPEWGRLCP